METLTALRRLFAGLVIVLLDIRIGTFDILLDPIGFFLVVWALGELALQSRSFAKAKVMAWILTILSIISLSFNLDLETNAFSSKDIGVWIFIFVNGMAQMMMAYFTFEGIQELVASINPTLASVVENRKWFYVGFHYLWLLILPLSLNIELYIMGPFVIFFGLIVFVLEILFIALIHRVRKELDLRQEES
jgi:hypothetical protein